MVRRSLDLEVWQRLIKAIDGLVLTIGALVLTVLLSTSNIPAAEGSFALLVALSSLFAVRGLGLYNLKSWHNGTIVAAKSFAAAALAGCDGASGGT